jgi:hypothetical protein
VENVVAGVDRRMADLDDRLTAFMERLSEGVQLQPGVSSPVVPMEDHSASIAGGRDSLQGSKRSYQISAERGRRDGAAQDR